MNFHEETACELTVSKFICDTVYVRESHDTGSNMTYQRAIPIRFMTNCTTQHLHTHNILSHVCAYVYYAVIHEMIRHTVREYIRI